jgi:Cof subfamily protein (haloacid dehalogenase superfamily)
MAVPESGGRTEPTFTRVTPTQVADEVARQIRGLLVGGRLAPGDRLPSERDLAEELGVGRPAVREALRDLRAEGLIVTGRGRQGTTVATGAQFEGVASPHRSPSQPAGHELGEPVGFSGVVSRAADGTITQFLELRAAVETQAAALAVRRGDAADLEAIGAALPEPDLLDADHDRRFHEAIAAATHNPLVGAAVRDLVARLHDLASESFPALYLQPHRAAISGQHAAIHAAIRNGDEEGARRSRGRHLDYIARALDRMLGSPRGINMVVCDLDGTILAGPRLITERTREAIAAARDQEVVVVLASARPPRAMRLYHELLGLSTPVIAGNGALLWNLGSSIPLARESIDRELAAEMIALGRTLGTIVNVESDDEWFSERTNERVLRNLKVYGLEPPHRVGPVDELLERDDPIDKVFLDLRDLPPARMNSARASVQSTFGDRANITETADGLIDLVSHRASKAVMAQRLARSRGIGADEVAAIGDHDNDVSLLRWAGTGIAMGNATIAAKKAADVVTSSNLRDGVAEAIYTWVLGR